MKYLIFLGSLFLFLGCKQQTKESQMNTYYSSNKSFSIDIPVDYTQYEARTNYISFFSEKQKGTIKVERKFLIESDDFKKYINISMAKVPSKFHCSTVSISDTIHHYKYTAGMFIAHQYYMRKILDGYSYVVSLNGINISDNTAKAIYNSIKSY